MPVQVRVAVLSDTHVRSYAELPLKMRDALAEVDLIVHAGDFVARDVLEGLKRAKKVKAVRGNMDSYELQEMLPDRETITVRGKTIGVTHGFGSPQGIEERVRRMFHEVDVVVYGHSHVARNEVVGGVLLFNPGRGNRSFGLLTIGDEIKGEIVEL